MKMKNSEVGRAKASDTTYKYKIIALMGPAGSGKDRMMKEVISLAPHDLHEIISCTTRPVREGEAEGVNYYYMSGEDFGDKVLNGEMLEASCFNDWFYGTSYESLRSDVVNIGVFNIEGIESLATRPDIDLYVYYIKAKDKTRMLRQLNREEDPNVHEIVRRFKTDYIDFDGDYSFKYTEIDNETEDDLKAGAKNILCQS